MFQSGLIEEVRAILARGFPPTAKPFESHGYRQAVQLLNGELSLKEAVFYAQRNTRRYAKRQMTWFRQETGMEWFSGFGDDPQIQQAVEDRVREFLALSHI
jgi:tRNA dimethylallyltransferase